MMYVCMQTFAVPGTLSLSLLSGALYGPVHGLLLVSGKDLSFWSLHTDAYLLCPSIAVTQRRILVPFSDQYAGGICLLWHVVAVWTRSGISAVAGQTGTLFYRGEKAENQYA